MLHKIGNSPLSYGISSPSSAREKDSLPLDQWQPGGQCVPAEQSREAVYSTDA